MRCSSAAHSSSALCGGIVGRHAHRDARRAVGEQVGEAGRQHHRLGAGAVVGRAEVDRLLVDAFEQRLRHLGQPALGVAHGGGVIAVDVAEVALAVDQRIAHGEVLGQPHQRVVDRLVAVRVVVAHHLADDLGALLVAAGGVELQLAHGVEDAPVHGLQAVAHVGQRAVHDGRQRVGEVALLQRILQQDRLDAVGTGQNWFVAHAIGLSRGAKRRKPGLWMHGTLA